jgi:bifunctional DNA-binding transcriptional regulator/antitoxin component of YhaV-PrlF toxin-antitoxin module
VGMALVQLDSRHRLTLPRKIRKKFKIVDGQRFFLLQFGDDLIMKAVPKNPSEEMSKIINNLQFGKKDREEAEKWLLKETTRRKRSSS